MVDKRGKQNISTNPPGCVYCVYGLRGFKTMRVPPAVRTVRTLKGDRDLCEKHALEVEKGAVAK